MKKIALTLAAAFALSGPALAYDGTNCKSPGNCWEPKPGYPEKVEGSQYDPQHDPVELNKQTEALANMQQRNSWRIYNAKKTGTFEFDVKKIEGYDETATPPAE